MNAVLNLGRSAVFVSADRVKTYLPGGASVIGIPHATPEYARTAREHGYGDDIARMNRCHEVAHSLLAAVLRLPCSPVFRRIAAGVHEPDEVTRCEEAAVLALEAYANALSLDLIEVAKGWSTS